MDRLKFKRVLWRLEDFSGLHIDVTIVTNDGSVLSLTNLESYQEINELRVHLIGDQEITINYLSIKSINIY
jgi:hypothetical protein